MQQKVDFTKLLELEQGMRPLNRKFDEDQMAMYVELRNMVTDIY